jgi:hypothetical protein
MDKKFSALGIELLPGLDALYDIAVPVLLVVYWISFFRDAYRTMSGPAAPHSPPMIDHER